jgi:hypothetical protein
MEDSSYSKSSINLRCVDAAVRATFNLTSSFVRIAVLSIISKVLAASSCKDTLIKINFLSYYGKVWKHGKVC